MHEELLNRLKNLARLEAKNGESVIYVSSEAAECIKEIAQEAADAIEELEEKAQAYAETLYAYEHPWIPVTERLPEDGQWVLCMCRAEIIDVLKYSNGIAGPWYKDSRHVFMKRFVTHWMPLPMPPKQMVTDSNQPNKLEE